MDSTLYANVCINVHVAITTTQTAAAKLQSQGLGRNFRNPSKVKVAVRGSPAERWLDLPIQQRETKQNKMNRPGPCPGGIRGCKM